VTIPGPARRTPAARLTGWVPFLPGAGWGIDRAVAEYIIRRRRSRPASRATTEVGTP
jgi:hypothetical protein